MMNIREMIDIILVNDRDAIEEKEADRAKWLDLAKKLDALQQRIREELAKSFGDRTDETSTSNGVTPQVAAKRAERDIERRDKLNQLTKKQASVRASMGT